MIWRLRFERWSSGWKSIRSGRSGIVYDSDPVAEYEETLNKSESTIGGNEMIVLIDNYDSFTYNLYQLLGEYEEDIVVVRNDQITIEQLEG